jgi:hypothetical protein
LESIGHCGGTSTTCGRVALANAAAGRALGAAEETLRECTLTVLLVIEPCRYDAVSTARLFLFSPQLLSTRVRFFVS